MNVYDSERMGDTLAADGYEQTANLEEADLVLLNTCHIREKAAEKVYSEIGRIRKIKQAKEAEGGSMTIGVTGCVAQAEGKEIMRRAPVVELVAGPQTYHNLPDMVARAKSGRRVTETEFEIAEKFARMPPASRSQTQKRGVAAFLTVQEGCDKFCTFCVVPYTRGAEVSRTAEQIVEEAERLADHGVREITLLGQNVNAWHGVGRDGAAWRLSDLLFRLSEIGGVDRLRYTTSHPIDMDQNLIDAHRDLACLMPYLHLPIQAGSDRILKAMNRHHKVDDYLYIIELMRKARPDMAISGDFIVGFPGETEADFEQTMDVVREVRYASAFSFKYSPRPGTPGADLEGQITNEIASERLQRLQTLLNKQQSDFNASCVGLDMEILLEKPGRRSDQLIGRSPWLQSVVVPSTIGNIGEIVSARIASAGPNSLIGE